MWIIIAVIPWNRGHPGPKSAQLEMLSHQELYIMDVLGGFSALKNNSLHSSWRTAHCSLPFLKTGRKLKLFLPWSDRCEKKSSTLHQNPIYTELGLKNGFEKTLLAMIVPCSFVAFKQVLRWHAAWNPVDFEPTGCCFYPTSCKQGTTLSTVWAMLQPAATKI